MAILDIRTVIDTPIDAIRVSNDLRLEDIHHVSVIDLIDDGNNVTAEIPIAVIDDLIKALRKVQELRACS